MFHNSVIWQKRFAAAQGCKWQSLRHLARHKLIPRERRRLSVVLSLAVTLRRRWSFELARQFYRRQIESELPRRPPTVAVGGVRRCGCVLWCLALVLSRLDYGNGTLVGLPIHLIRRLQSVQNAAARLIFRLRRSDHITDALISLHWLRLPERIVFLPGTARPYGKGIYVTYKKNIYVTYMRHIWQVVNWHIYVI